MLQTITNKKLRTFLHIAFAFVSVLLCLVLVFNAGIVDCFAFALPAVAVLVGLSMLAATGITFATYEAGEAGVNAMYNNMDSATQSSFDVICDKVSSKASTDTSILKCAVQMTADYWADVLKAIIATFGTYAGITAHQIVSSSGLLTTGETFNFTVNNVSVNNAIDVSLGNATLRYIGGSSSASLPSYVELSTFSSNRIARCLDIAGFTFALDIGSFQLNQTFNLSQEITYTIPSGLVRSTYINFSGNSIDSRVQYFNGLPITKTVIDATAGTFTWNYSTGANIVSGNMLGDIALPDGICPDGVWTNKSWSDWLNDVIFGTGAGVGALPGNPSIDTTYTAGNDTWHDGSINDDVAIGSSPSIGISVPTTQDGAISLNPDQARDTSTADVTIDATDVATGTGTGTGTGSLPNSNPGNTLPALSLPEVLFKEKFPFCLPWDIYVLFSSLNAEPEAPKFVIPFKIERFGIDEAITIDFAEYEEPVKILRYFLCVIFVLGLILVSRKIIGA